MVKFCSRESKETAGGNQELSLANQELIRFFPPLR